MELRHLRYFVAVAEELHFGRAARRLLMTQPPLSMQIQQLEREVGVTLLRRTKRNVELTDAGKQLLIHARKVIQAADEAILVTQRAQQGKVGELDIAFASDIANRVLPPLIKDYRARFPDVELRLRETPTAEQVTLLLTDQVHVGFLHPPIPSDGLNIRLLKEEYMILAIPAGHRLAGSAPVELSELANESFVRYPRRLNPGSHDMIWGRLVEAGVQLHVAQEAGQVTTLLSLVASGVGLAILPSSVRALEREGVEYRELAHPIPLQIGVAWRADATNPILAGLLAVIDSMFRPTPLDRPVPPTGRTRLLRR